MHRIFALLTMTALAACSAADATQAEPTSDDAEEVAAAKTLTCKVEYKQDADFGFPDGFTLKVTTKTATLRDLTPSETLPPIKALIDPTYKPINKTKYDGYKRYVAANAYRRSAGDSTFDPKNTGFEKHDLEILAKPGDLVIYLRDKNLDDVTSGTAFLCR